MRTKHSYWLTLPHDLKTFPHFLQTTEQIQHLTVSSTTNPTTTGHHSSASSTISPIHSSHGGHKNLLKDSTITTSGGKPQNLSQRIKFLQSQLAHAPMPSITSKRRQLPSIEEAWNLPISAEMSSRQQQSAQANQQRSIAKGAYNTQVGVKLLFLVWGKYEFFVSRWYSAGQCVQPSGGLQQSIVVRCLLNRQMSRRS